MENLTIEQGFQPIAGAAFIGEHSFASKDIPIANGRPDELDIQKAMDFGVRIKEKIAALPSIGNYGDINIPGTLPYQAGGAISMKVSPVTIEERCEMCGTCATVCPTEAITVDNLVETQIERCISCCACIKSCPADARIIEDTQWKNIANWLKENCSNRKEPQFFGIDA